MLAKCCLNRWQGLRNLTNIIKCKIIIVKASNMSPAFQNLAKCSNNNRPRFGQHVSRMTSSFTLRRLLAVYLRLLDFESGRLWGPVLDFWVQGY